MAANKKAIALVLAFSLLASAAAYKLLQQNGSGITASGTVEITRWDVMPKTNGYLENFHITVGDEVQSGQVITQLKRPDLAFQLAADEAALARAIAQLRDLTAGDRPQERQQFAATVLAAEATYTKAQADYERYTSLAQSGAIPLQQLDSARTARDVAYTVLVSAKERLSLSDAGARPEALEVQRLEVERCRALLETTRILLADTLVRSPASGLVLTKNYENGEYITPGAALVTIGNMSDCWVKIYVSSTQLGLVYVGQGADIKVDSFPKQTFHGIVKEIGQSAEFTPRQTITQKERANMVFYVKVQIDNTNMPLKPGMPADVVLK